MERTPAQGGSRETAIKRKILSITNRSVPLHVFLPVFMLAIISTTVAIVTIVSHPNSPSVVLTEQPHKALEIRLEQGEKLEPSELEQLAASGNTEAQLLLGEIYRSGAQPNLAQSFNWYLKAAEAGNPVAQTMVAEMYAYGYGVKQDYAKAADWAAHAQGRDSSGQ